MVLPQDPAELLLGIFTVNYIFAILFIVARNWKQLSISGRRNKENVVHLLSGILLSY